MVWKPLEVGDYAQLTPESLDVVKVVWQGEPQALLDYWSGPMLVEEILGPNVGFKYPPGIKGWSSIGSFYFKRTEVMQASEHRESRKPKQAVPQVKQPDSKIVKSIGICPCKSRICLHGEDYVGL